MRRMRHLLPLLLLTACGYDTDLVLDNGYRLDITSGTFVEPAGMGDALEQAVNREILLAVLQADSSQIELMGALTEADADAQAACLPTLHLPAGDFSDAPAFEVGPVDATLPLGTILLPVEGLVVSGTFADDGSAIEGLSLSGRADTRPLAAAMGENADDDLLCSLAEAVDVSCVACAGGGEFCIDFEITDLRAPADDRPEPRHTPETSDPAEGSTNLCDDAACSDEPVCGA